MKFSLSSFPGPIAVIKQVIDMAERNGCCASARVRLTVFAGNGSLYDVNGRSPNYLIEAAPLQPKGFTLNERGLVSDIFRDAVKPCDIFSPVKSNNFLPYVMGAIWATEKELDDCILLNPYDNVADATIANVFIVKDGLVKTPPLADGPVNGVMRKYLLKRMKENGMPCMETSLTVEEVLQASEVFFTNAIKGIGWVERIGESRYTNQISSYLHSKFLTALTA
jgi:branched-chain amino acid aminotransferase